MSRCLECLDWIGLGVWIVGVEVFGGVLSDSGGDDDGGDDKKSMPML